MQKYLVVGLGNVGEKYENTRHNIGFLVADELAKKLEAPFLKTHFGSLAQGKYKGRPVLVLKPDTYMNLSGNALNYWLAKENIALENLLILTDDLNLPIGTLRMKTKGSHGGHNGLRSIESILQTAKYPRLRLGIGKEFSPGEQVDYVLGEWTEQEKKHLEKIIPSSAKASMAFCFHGIAQAMNSYNGMIESL